MLESNLKNTQREYTKVNLASQISHIIKHKTHLKLGKSHPLIQDIQL